MISLYKNYNNKVVLTLTERKTESDSTFLFEFEYDLSRGKKIFTTDDISTNISRYNKFIIETVSSPSEEDLTTGIIHISPGFGNAGVYKVYEIIGNLTDYTLVNDEPLEVGKFNILFNRDFISYDNIPEIKAV